jgi:hypothetical protein
MDFPGEKLVIKLWETLAEKGIGSLLSPWQTGREGRVRNQLRREEILMLAQAEKDAADIRSGKTQLLPDGSLLLPSASSTPSHEGRFEPNASIANAIGYGNRSAAVAAARTEINASKAILFAEEQLAKDEQEPSERRIDEDWLFMWREHAGRVSTEDLQRLWGSILAGEAKSPGSYSIRTLEFLKTLSRSEAGMIGRLASYVIDGRIARSQTGFLESRGFNFSILLQLQEMGIVSGVEALGLNVTYKSIVEDKFIRPLVSHGKALIVEHDDPARTLEFEIYMLTVVGRQVLGLGSFAPDVEYLRLVGRDFVNKGFNVKLADWRDVSEAKGEYFNAQQILTENPLGTA